MRYLRLLPCLVLLVASCSKKVEPPPKPIAPVVEHPAVPKAGIEFQEAEKQKKYAELFLHYYAMFEAPARGSVRWLRLANGQLIGGTIEKATEKGVAMSIELVPRTVVVSEFAQESREHFFATDFARANALRELNGEQHISIATNAIPTPRYAMLDISSARIGPGFEYKEVIGDQVSRGQAVTFCDDFNGWLRIDEQSAGPRWIPKCLTYALNEFADPTLISDVELMTKSGLLVAVSAETNEARVDFNAWQGTDFRMRRGIARTLAAYCSSVSSNATMFVTIRGSATERKLGKYSQSQGWKESGLSSSR